MNTKYTIGLDFGTLSCRAVVVDVSNGEVIASSASEYPHAVISNKLPTGEKLPEGWALQHPQDYLDTMNSSVKKVVKDSNVDVENIIGIGIDFTASTTLPTNSNGTPLLFLPEFANEKHAYVKLWKHHGSGKQVEQLNNLLIENPLPRIMHYGGEFNPESSLPRQVAVLQESPKVYEAMQQWIEAGDWIVWQLTGNLCRGVSGAGIKEMYDIIENTYPEKEFLKKIDPRLENLYDDKHQSVLLPLGAKAGNLIAKWAKDLELKEGIAVASANMDGHVSAPVIGMERPDQVMAVIGTSCGWFMLSDDMQHKDIPGILGSVNHAMYPDMNCYEAGQSAVGDIYAWFVDNCIPASYKDEAKSLGVSIHQLLTDKALKLKPGESGLLALDWLNGNRSPLSNSNLTGTILGLNLHTKPEEIYRALLEAVAFGGKKIVDNYAQHGLAATSMLATGGISQKNSLAMQIYADVLNIPVNIAASENGPAHGSALFGAVAAGSKAGGYDSIRDAASAMRQAFSSTYLPIIQNVKIYTKLYDEYCKLYNYFGIEKNNPMFQINKIKQSVIN